MAPSLGVLFAPKRPIAELQPAARSAEALGFDEFWVVEDCFLGGGLTASAAALGATTKLRVGVGLLPVSVRNPAITAMELATLASLYPQRFIAAFGHGVEAWMRQIGARPADRIVALREVVGAVNALLRGETVDVDGRFVQLADVTLEQPPEFPPPVLIGTTGTKSIAVAGEVADGVLLPEGAGAGAVAWCAGQFSGSVTTYAWLRVGDDAEAELTTLVRDWVEWGLYPNLVRAGDVDVDRPEEAIGRIAVAGSPQDCADALTRLGEAGASSVVLVPVGPGPDEQLERFAAEVRPLLTVRS